MAELQQLIAALAKHSRVTVSLPFLRYELDLNQALDPKTVDERIARLAQIHNDLEAAGEAVRALQREAHDNRTEADSMRAALRQLEQDKVTAETLLQVPEESFARMLARANSKARIRGIVEGLSIGLLTGLISSLAVWYVTG